MDTLQEILIKYEKVNLATLSVAERVALLVKLSKFSLTSLNDGEAFVVKLLETIPSKDYKSFSYAFEKSMVYAPLCRAIDDEGFGAANFTKFTNLLFKIANEGRKEERALSKKNKTIPMLQLGKIQGAGKTYEAGFLETDYQLWGNEFYKLNYVKKQLEHIEYNAPIPSRFHPKFAHREEEKELKIISEKDLSTLKPFDWVKIRRDEAGLPLLNFQAQGKYIYVPTLYLQYYADKMHNQDIYNTLSVVSIVLGTGAVITGAAAVPIVLGVMSIASGIFELSLQNNLDFKTYINSSKATPQEKNTYAAIQALMAVPAVVTLLRGGVGGVRSLSKITAAQWETIQPKLQAAYNAIKNNPEVLKSLGSRFKLDFNAQVEAIKKLGETAKTQTIKAVGNGLNAAKKIVTTQKVLEIKDKLVAPVMNNDELFNFLKNYRRLTLYAVDSVTKQSKDNYKIGKYIVLDFVIYKTQNYLRALGYNEGIVQNISNLMYKGGNTAKYPDGNTQLLLYFFNKFKSEFNQFIEISGDYGAYLKEASIKVQGVLSTEVKQTIDSEKQMVASVNKIVEANPNFNSSKKFLVFSNVNGDKPHGYYRTTTDYNKMAAEIEAAEKADGVPISLIFIRQHGADETAYFYKHEDTIKFEAAQMKKFTDKMSSEGKIIIYEECSKADYKNRIDIEAVVTGVDIYASKYKLAPQTSCPFIFNRRNDIYDLATSKGVLHEGIPLKYIAKKVDIPFASLAPFGIFAAYQLNNPKQKTTHKISR